MMGTGLFAAHKNKLLVFYDGCQVLRAQNHNATQLPQLLAARAPRSTINHVDNTSICALKAC